MIIKLLADDVDVIQSTVKKYVEQNYDLVIFTGGTGLSQRDNTPEAIGPLIEKKFRALWKLRVITGSNECHYAMLSRSVSGFIKNTLVLTLPGSTRGVEETMDALFPQVLHVFKVRENKEH